jgi:nucleoside-diphosphate-sugar epimerase
MSLNILVTGGAGYIGSHVCKALAAAGYLPIAYDNLCRGHRWAVKWGPLEDMHPGDGRVVSNFVIQALRSEDITVYGDGIQTHAFCYVDDVVDGAHATDQTPEEVRAGKPPAAIEAFTFIRLLNFRGIGPFIA